MPLITPADFAKLRLVDFAEGEEVARLEDWEFLDQDWIGEAIGFTEWLRSEKTPENLGCISVGFKDLSVSATDAVLKALGLPIRAGMKVEVISELFGEPRNQLVFRQDRKTYEYEVGPSREYLLSCTVENDSGLVYFRLVLLSALNLET